jgi:uncharacterized membrane protein YkvA (DUF1232 family)
MSTETAPVPVDFTPAEERRLWKKLARVAARITFADQVIAAWYCAIDPQTPRHVRGILLAALGYFILPADAVPDLIAGLGFTDDAAVLATVLATVGQHLSAEHRARAKARLDELLR